MTRARRRVFVLFALLVPVALLSALEGGLRVFSYGESLPLFVPVEEAPRLLRANPNVVRRFVVNDSETPDLSIRPVYFTKEKAPNALRVFVQGGSTAEGYPYGYGASPAGMLQQRLQRTFPERRVEVITTAMCAVNTYTLLDFTGEIIDHEPDAVVIYSGHNEYVGLLGVGSGFSVGLHRASVLGFLALRDSRVVQLLQGAFAAAHPAPRRSRSDRTLMATIVREKRIPLGSALYHLGLDQYRANLRAILARYRSAGVPVFIGTVVSNERNQAPFISGHGPGVDVENWARHFDRGRRALEQGDTLTALPEFERAIEIDDAPAEGHFRRAQALDRLGRNGEAREAYLAAKDRDELRFRAPEAINAILREEAGSTGAHVVEVQEALVRAARDGIVGKDLMLEHLHPNLRGYFVMADAFYEAFHSESAFGAWDCWVPPDQAWDERPVTVVDRLYGDYRIRYLTSDWPFTERKHPTEIPRPTDRVERIAQKYYDGRLDWPAAMRELLEHYRVAQDDSEAARVAVLLADAFPHDVQEQLEAADLLSRAGRSDAHVYRRRRVQLGTQSESARVSARGASANGK